MNSLVSTSSTILNRGFSIMVALMLLLHKAQPTSTSQYHNHFTLLNDFEMGILSNPEKREKIFKSLKRWKNPLSVIGYIGGILGLLAMASNQYNNRGEILEGALLPGMVETRYSEDILAQKYYNKLTEICSKNMDLQRDWLETELLAAGLEVFKQNFTCKFRKTEGRNIYGILRSGRSSGVESLVLNVPFRPNCQSNGGLALMLSVANYFKQLNCWAKDIIFLVTEKGSCGVTAWLQSYHGQKSNEVISSDLLGYAGKIQAALLVDFPNSTIVGINVHTESLNGLTPDLDVIGMIRIISQSEGIPAKLHTQDSFYGASDVMENYFQSLKTLVRTMLQQASGYSSGDHGKYLNYRIEAITIKGTIDLNQHSYISFLEMGKMIEAAFRSFNNLLEHFHQSYFFYLLPKLGRFIKITQYMPALGGLLVSILLHSVSLWIEMFASMDQPNSKKVQHENDVEISWRVAVVLIISHIIGGCSFLSLCYVVQSDNWLTDGYVSKSIVISSMVILLTLQKLQLLKTRMEWEILKLISMIYLAVVIITSAMLNFSFGFLLAVGFTPTTILMDMNKKRMRRALQYAMVVFSSPICLIALLTMLHITVSQESTIELADLFNETFKLIDSALLNAIMDQHLNVWTLPVITLAILPIWFMLAVLSCPLHDD